MLCIISHDKRPAFNLAAEEYFFRNFDEDIFLLYINTPSVVIGKHQNALAEINPKFVRENNIEVIRRLSGGGAVYHDQGNINFSFHRTVSDTAKVSFKAFNEPIIAVLRQLGVAAELSKRNDILVNGFKVSGHAEHVFRNRVLSHGTLLFDANKEMLSRAIKHPAGEFIGKSIQSVRSKIANISEFLPQQMETAQFITEIENFMLKNSKNASKYTPGEDDYEKIEKLMIEKYSIWEWNFGYSPKYRFAKKAGKTGIDVFVEKGIIKEISLSSSSINDDLKNDICLRLTNTKHEYHSIEHQLNNMITNQQTIEILECLF
ncbi:MAG: lipoate--protein ligase [Prolixibacteraceae bacterium]|jgi:lipoate-protein ligase A|nr:lipoate--protein ligase [Prolixibacteraceae bacterium]